MSGRSQADKSHLSSADHIVRLITSHCHEWRDDMLAPRLNDSDGFPVRRVSVVGARLRFWPPLQALGPADGVESPPRLGARAGEDAGTKSRSVTVARGHCPTDPDHRTNLMARDRVTRIRNDPLPVSAAPRSQDGILNLTSTRQPAREPAAGGSRRFGRTSLRPDCRAHEAAAGAELGPRVRTPAPAVIPGGVERAPDFHSTFRVSHRHLPGGTARARVAHKPASARRCCLASLDFN